MSARPEDRLDEIRQRWLEVIRSDDPDEPYEVLRDIAWLILEVERLRAISGAAPLRSEPDLSRCPGCGDPWVNTDKGLYHDCRRAGRAAVPSADWKTAARVRLDALDAAITRYGEAIKNPEASVVAARADVCDAVMDLCEKVATAAVCSPDERRDYHRDFGPPGTQYG